MTTRGACLGAIGAVILLMPLALPAQVPGAQRTVSAVGQLGLGDTIARAGVTRQLVCRGKEGIDLRIDRDSSPRDPRLAMMTLRYDRSSEASGLDYARLQPGACTWNPGSFDGVPPEPGVVHFDVPREAQPWSATHERQLDTTATAAAHYPDVHTMPRYLGDPAHFWVFYVDDVTNVSVSFGAHVTERRPPTLTTVRGRYETLSGASLLTDGISGSVRDASVRRAGATTDRVSSTRKTGTESAAVGTLVRAELRLVAVNTVLDRFTIEFSARPNATPSVRYSTEQPIKRAGTDEWTFPGGVVQGSGAVEGGFAAEVAGGAASGFRATYTAWSRVPPERGKVYHFIITVPATPDQPIQQHVGQLTTVAQHARVVFTAYNLIDAWTYTQFNLFAGEGAPIKLRTAEGAYRLTGISRDVANAPDLLEILVLAESWESNPDILGDKNSATGVVNIGITPLERSFRIPFRIRSGTGWVWQLDFDAPKPPSVLTFEVEGYIEVTRR
ncbi:MAG TPA: hypothetical protein VFT04_11315 [Gemmatimonadales bacterium]|nr:hypothetical protein [Gemmatimonadales bacterium]